jgi:hypothetical protein
MIRDGQALALSLRPVEAPPQPAGALAAALERNALLLGEGAGLGPAEAAEVVYRSTADLRADLHRARRMLCELLDPRLRAASADRCGESR